MPRLAAVLALALFPVAASAAPSACPQYFLDGEAPDLTNPKLAEQTREICYSAYALLHSGVTRTPVWSAEHLTREQAEAAAKLKRPNAFHPEPSLPADQRAELSDYARSGYDRGHMSPSGDMPTPDAQNESFTLANMIPQNPDNNQHLWEGIEAAVRHLAELDGELYVVTGPIYRGETVKSLHDRVLVPTDIFKAVYDPNLHQAGAYLVPNAAGDKWQAVSIAQLQELTGIDVFHGLPDEVKTQAMDLPKPILRKRTPNPRVTPHG